MISKLKILLVLAFVLLFSTQSSLASGSYGGYPPRPPSSDHRAKYSLGKSIFTRKIELKETSDKANQKSLLSEWQMKLPTSAQGRANLSELAGKLTDNQLAALEHYLAKRYKIK